MMNVFSGRPVRAAYFVLSLVILISSCEKPEESLGLELVPEESLLGLKTYTDSLLLSTYTVPADSTRSNELSRALLGDLTLFGFGDVTSNIYTQVRLSALSVDFTGGTGDSNDVVLDSLVLSLEYLEEDSLYGNVEEMMFSVEQLTTDLDLDSLYYSNYSTTTTGVELMETGSQLITPSPTDSVTINGSKFPPQLRLRLSETLGNALIAEATDGSAFDDVSDFIEFVKGFKISASSPGGDGAILGLDLLAAQSKLSLYYHNTLDTTSFDMVINESAQRYLAFDHDYLGTDAQNAIDNPGTEVFIQSMAGVNVQVELPSLIGLTDTLQGAFNKVEVVFPVSSTMDEEFFPERLFAVYKDMDGDVISIPDIFEGSLHSDGNYDPDAGEYRLNITRYAQQVVNGVIEQSVPILQILPVSNAISATAVRLNGVGNVMGGAKLVVTYTQYE